MNGNVQTEILFGGLRVNHHRAIPAPHEPKDCGRSGALQNHAERHFAGALDGELNTLGQRRIRAECGMHAPGQDDAAADDAADSVKLVNLC